jgi:hypothetical protein
MTTAPMPKAEFLTEAEYYERFAPIEGPDGSDIWEHRYVQTKPTSHIWSVVEVDGDLFVIPGWHVVNVIGFNVTEQPWTHDNIEVRLDSIDV